MAVVEVKKKKHIYWAEINQPDSNNAIDFEVMGELEMLLDEIEQNRRIRVFILSGSGQQYFVSGGNIKAFSDLHTEKEGREMASRMATLLNRLEQNRFWTMACVNGEAYGGGCEMILAFDFVIASKTATFSFTQARFGLPPAWGGVTRLVERVGRSRALEWLGAHQSVSSEEAFYTGLINKLSITSELRRNTWEWALELSRIDPDLIAELKKATRVALETTRNESMRRELDRFAHFWATPLHHRKVEEFLKRSKK